MAAKFYEHASRSLVKSLTFRCLVLISDGIIVFSITHKYEVALGVILATNLASMFLYYIHERFWNGVHWGKAHKKK